MPLPVNARVLATPSFARCLDEALDFLQGQDADAAARRQAALRAQLRQAREHLTWNPAAGRPARFLALRSWQGRSQAARAQALAAELGLPHLREWVLKPWVLLYAHDAQRVLLLALKHERQLGFSLT